MTVRNLFDQYDQPENRLTHALVCALNSDRRLLVRFLRECVRVTPPRGSRLHVVEQRLPGDAEGGEEAPERRGLPDAVIHDDDGWGIAIESKVAATLTCDQLDRHRRTLANRGFEQLHLAVIDAKPIDGDALGRGVVALKWSDIYAWARRQPSSWARKLAEYLEVAEARMIDDGYLKEGALTRFDGVRFGPENPYSYGEAKRLLRLVMAELRRNKTLRRDLGADLGVEGRPSITGSSGVRVWDFIPLRAAARAKQHTEFPHLTVDIGTEEARAYVSFPNGMRRRSRRRLLEGKESAFRELLGKVLKAFRARFRRVAGAAPYVEVAQRRFLSQRGPSLPDATLRFDLRTAFGKPRWPDKSAVRGKRVPAVRIQPQWLEAVRGAIADKHSNLHLSVGMAFPYGRCPAIASRDAVQLFASAWLACKPLLDRVQA